jgi:hypothetical protein
VQLVCVTDAFVHLAVGLDQRDDAFVHCYWILKVHEISSFTGAGNISFQPSNIRSERLCFVVMCNFL